jgi:hypothetical protein
LRPYRVAAVAKSLEAAYREYALTYYTSQRQLGKGPPTVDLRIAWIVAVLVIVLLSVASLALSEERESCAERRIHQGEREMFSNLLTSGEMLQTETFRCP